MLNSTTTFGGGIYS
ncbi:hypothetical protein DW172_16550, partial [Agathobacter rectalis]